MRGQRAVEWRLVDDVAKPAQFAQTVQERAAALAAASDRPADGKGVALTPLERDDRRRRAALRARRRRRSTARARTATFTVKAPDGAQPTDIAGIEAAGAAWWPLAMARELDDAILSMRTNELDIGTWLLKTEGDARGRARHAMRRCWRTRTTGSCAKRSACCAARLRGWMCRRARLFALIEPGSCFAGTLAELALAADRTYMLALPDDAEPPRRR